MAAGVGSIQVGRGFLQHVPMVSVMAGERET